MASSSVYSHRFGSLVRAYTLLGFTPERDYAYLEINDQPIQPGFRLHRPPRPLGQQFAPGRCHSMQTQRVELRQTIGARTVSG